jgi:succinylglutamate desuccinylase
MKSIIHTFGRNPIVTVACSVHGEETFSQTVYHYLLANYKTLGSFRLILANPTACARRIRYCESDLNRSFPGLLTGTAEQQIAHQLMPELKKTDYVIDIHTTVSDIGMVPIITHLHDGTIHLLNATDRKNVAFIQSSTTSLISHAHAGVALEFNQEYAQTEPALAEVLTVLRRIQNNARRPSRQRSVYFIDGTLSKSQPLPAHAKNFTKLKPDNVYPFLLHPNSYPDIHCHTASKVQRMRL